MTRPVSLTVVPVDVNRWQAARILAACRVFARVIDPTATIIAIHNSKAKQIGWTLTVSEHVEARLRAYIARITTAVDA